MPSVTRIGQPFVELHSVDSTNNYAMGLVHAGMARHGMAVFSHEQTMGRGQRNKQWISEPGNNIALSLVVEPSGMAASQMFWLSKVAATATLFFFNRLTRGGCSIKWPNDLFWGDRKAGGILIDNVLQGSEWKYAVAGIGLNINQTGFGPLSGTAVSLKQITGRSFVPLDLARDLCEQVDIQWSKMLYAPDEINRDYHQHLYKRNEVVRFKKGPQVFEGRVKAVTDQGELVVEHAMEQTFTSGEIEWLLA